MAVNVCWFIRCCAPALLHGHPDWATSHSPHQGCSTGYTEDFSRGDTTSANRLYLRQKKERKGDQERCNTDSNSHGQSRVYWTLYSPTQNSPSIQPAQPQHQDPRTDQTQLLSVLPLTKLKKPHKFVVVFFFFPSEFQQLLQITFPQEHTQPSRTGTSAGTWGCFGRAQEASLKPPITGLRETIPYCHGG